MQRRAALWAASMLLTVAGGLLWAQTQGSTPPAAATPTFKPVTDVETMMEGQDLLMENIKAAIKDNKWDEARYQAWVLAELANVNMHQDSRPAYMQFAADMSKQCVALARTLKKKSADEAKKGVSLVAQTCTACHDKYREE